MKNVDVNQTFPGFSTAFDVLAMKTLIGEILRKENNRVEVISCEISDVKYEPAKQCIFLYTVKLLNASTRQKWKQFFTGFLLKQNEIPITTTQQSFFLKEPKIVLFAFPHDPVLTWLSDAFGGDVVKEQMQRNGLFQKLNTSQINISLLAYKPQMRATFLYEIVPEDCKIEKQEWIAKTNAFKNPENVFANYWALWQESKGKIPMPQPMGFLSHPKITFQEKIQGTRLGAIVDSASFDEIIKKAARLIGHFHTLQIPLSNTRKLENETRILNRWCALLVHLLPELKSRLESLQMRLIAELESRINICAPIHADFHHTNLLVDGTEVRLIDLDDIAWGDPCLDIGRFLSSLRIPSLRVFGSFEGLEAMRELFLETYLKVAPRNVQNIRLFEAASLFTSAGSAFRLQRPEWRNDVSMLLNEAEKTFERAKESKMFSLAKNLGSNNNLPEEVRLRWALDETYIHTLLSYHLLANKQQELVTCKLLEHKGRRSFHRIVYRITARKKKNKEKGKLELILLKKRTGRALYNRLVTRQGTSVASLLPRPIAYLPEIGAVVVEATSTNQIKKAISKEKGPGL